MNVNLNEKICAHDACTCPVESGEKFCSKLCEEALDETDCSCGHAECRAIA